VSVRRTPGVGRPGAAAVHGVRLTSRRPHRVVRRHHQFADDMQLFVATNANDAVLDLDCLAQ